MKNIYWNNMATLANIYRGFEHGTIPYNGFEENFLSEFAASTENIKAFLQTLFPKIVKSSLPGNRLIIDLPNDKISLKTFLENVVNPYNGNHVCEIHYLKNIPPLIAYCLDMAQEVKQTFPSLTIEHFACGTISSTHCWGMTIIYLTTYLPKIDYPNWNSLDKDNLNYSW